MVSKEIKTGVVYDNDSPRDAKRNKKEREREGGGKEVCKRIAKFVSKGWRSPVLRFGEMSTART